MMELRAGGLSIPGRPAKLINMSPILNWLQMTLMFSDRIRVAETVCNETENYGKDDNWMGISNRTYERLEHKREKRRGRENRDKETTTTARLGNSAAWASGCSGSLYSSGACKPPAPFLISFRRKQWFLAGSKAANTGDRLSQTLSSDSWPAAGFSRLQLPTLPLLAASQARARMFESMLWGSSSGIKCVVSYRYS